MHTLENVSKVFKTLVGKNVHDEEVSQQLESRILELISSIRIKQRLKGREDETKQAMLGESVDNFPILI